MDTANVIRQLLGEYERQREENYREEQRRKREASGVDPEILELINERAIVFGNATRAAFANGRVDTQAMQVQLEALSARIREKLIQAGFPEDYLQPIYRCPVCRDTGYVGELIREKCNCLKQRIKWSQRKGCGLFRWVVIAWRITFSGR